MTESAATATLPAALDGQPVARVHRDGVEYVLLGTAHVSRASVEAVNAILDAEPFDAVAIELCDSRARAMRDPDAFKRMDLFQVIRQGKVGMVAASLVLSSYQKRLAEQFGIEPGAEMKAGMDGAAARELPLWLVDREIGTTLKRCWRGLGFGDRMQLLLGLIASVFEREDIAEEDIEKLKQGDLMEGAFAEFAKESAPLYHGLIAERDSYMAASLREHAADAPTVRRVLVVIGAGHLAGTRQEIETQQQDPATQRAALTVIPPASRWPKYLAIGVLVAIFAAIGWAFHRSAAHGAEALKWWVLLTGGGAALGALISAAHPLSILAAFVAAPLKPFRPGVPAGAVSALAECWLRRPRVGDFDTLRDDLVHASGWWKNRVARTFMIFMLVNLGTMAGEYAAGFHIVTSLLP
ncbi:MAG TPA: TraB/GumN family protein [Rhodanobacteraceae bacterium]|nr:TraB/GumN family protein [Rhodanobacteraceae bacterium]